jgi:hypothetical protein
MMFPFVCMSLHQLTCLESVRFTVRQPDSGGKQCVKRVQIRESPLAVSILSPGSEGLQIGTKRVQIMQTPTARKDISLLAQEIEVETFEDVEEFYSEDEDQIMSEDDEIMSGKSFTPRMEEELARERMLGPDAIVAEGKSVSVSPLSAYCLHGVSKTDLQNVSKM